VVSVLAKVGWTVAVVAVVSYLTGPHIGAAPGGGGDIPVDYLALYQGAGGTCPHLDWALLAAVGKVESDHGRSPLPGVASGANSAGAQGPMQFLPATFAGVRRRHPEVGPDAHDPADAIPAAAHLLCDNGVRDGRVRDAVWSYNHADWYVDKVLTQADVYR
jgi:hypothetical protein